MLRHAFYAGIASLALISGCASAEPATSDYGLTYTVILDKRGNAQVSLKVDQESGQLRQLRLITDGENLSAYSSNLAKNDGEHIWQVPENGGIASWQGSINQVRSDGSVSALGNDRWAVFRIEDVLPPIASKTLRGTQSRTRLVINAPDGWVVVAPYPGERGQFSVEDRGRRFDRPDGWILAGDIGVRHDLIANIQVAVAAPRNQSARRLDAMAFMNWHLPLVTKLFNDFPDRLVVAMVGEPFFRGGLSAPNSLFLHADRPMISGNGTSTLLHELFHVGLSRTAAKGEDWIVEGLAEYYSQNWLFEAGSVTSRRHERTIASLAKWSQESESLRAASSTGATTALAVGIFVNLDQEIRRRSNDTETLDAVVRRLAKSEEKLTLVALREAARAVLGRDARSLRDSALPGYSL